MDPVRAYAQASELPWSDEIETTMSKYVDELLHFNQSMNLIGPMDRDQVLISLVIDSLSAAATYPPGESLLDVGTGAGLPGIVLAICYPETAVTLVEPRKKRANFLRIVKNRLGLSNVTIHEARIEDVERSTFEYVISKAFRPPTEWLAEAATWVSEFGVVVCMHAKDATLETDLELVTHTTREDRAVSVYRRTHAS